MDFDKLFEEYLNRYFKDKKTDFKNAGEIEDILPSLYEKWAEMPSDKLKGLSPRGFYKNITSPGELIKIFLESSAGKANPDSLLTERMAQVPEAADGLKAVIIGNTFSLKQKMSAMNILNDLQACVPPEFYAEILKSESADKEIKELAAEILCAFPNEASESLFPLKQEDKDFLFYAAEILSRVDKKDERIYGLLTKLFKEGGDTAYAASLIGRYGDERFAPLLYKALDNCNYLEYLEIKNAIERLGGTVDENLRDFSDDVYYMAVKGVRT